jgi:hypothetical protein
VTILLLVLFLKKGKQGFLAIISITLQRKSQEQLIFRNSLMLHVGYVINYEVIGYLEIVVYGIVAERVIVLFIYKSKLYKSMNHGLQDYIVMSV